MFVDLKIEMLKGCPLLNMNGQGEMDLLQNILRLMGCDTDMSINDTQFIAKGFPKDDALLKNSIQKCLSAECLDLLKVLILDQIL